MIVRDLQRAADPEGTDWSTIDHDDPPLEPMAQGHATLGVELKLNPSDLVIEVRQRRLAPHVWVFDIVRDGTTILTIEP